MNKKAFHEYYSKIFNTKTFKETYQCFKSLSIEEQKKLTKERSEESRKKYLEKHPDRYKKVGEKLKGRIRGPNKKISESLKKYYSNENNRKKTSDAIKKYFKENPPSKERFEKQSKTLKKTYEKNPEIKKHISNSVRQWHADHPGIVSEKTKLAMEKFYKTPKGIENLLIWQNSSKKVKHSSEELEIYDFVKSIYNGNIENGNRTILGGKELDIYIPEKNIAIEYDGLFWHSEYFKRDINYHLEKTLKCEELGIRLIHIFGDEWENKKEIVKSIIKSSLGIYDKKYFARKLKFKKIESKEASKFFNENHINGNTPAKDYYALVDDDGNIIQAISIGKNRFSKKEKNYELIRMATKLNCQVLGGFSKLMNNIPYDYVESYIDRRLFSGKGYLSSNWTLIGYSTPRYFYTNGQTRENRMKFMKQRCLKYWPDSDPSKTEHELCNEHGFFQIFDCGTMKVAFKKN